jgi:hypothetical protein
MPRSGSTGSEDKGSSESLADDVISNCSGAIAHTEDEPDPSSILLRGERAARICRRAKNLGGLSRELGDIVRSSPLGLGVLANMIEHNGDAPAQAEGCAQAGDLLPFPFAPECAMEAATKTRPNFTSSAHSCRSVWLSLKVLAFYLQRENCFPARSPRASFFRAGGTRSASGGIRSMVNLNPAECAVHDWEIEPKSKNTDYVRLEQMGLLGDLVAERAVLGLPSKGAAASIPAESLAQELARWDADNVLPSPDSSRMSAEECDLNVLAVILCDRGIAGERLCHEIVARPALRGMANSFVVMIRFCFVCCSGSLSTSSPPTPFNIPRRKIRTH